MTSDTAAQVSTLRAAAEVILPDVIQVRRRLHQRPELGLALPHTQALVAEELARLGLDHRLGTGVGSVTALIDGFRPGRTIILRADMDALPLGEETGLHFSSQNEGVMHACGHDTHVAMLLGAARLLAARSDLFSGRVVLMFQPGEEGFHGARYMLEEGLLELAGEGPDTAAFALHISTKEATGTINLRPGPLLASADRIAITVRGRGGHASAPHLALDPIAVAAEIVLALQLMVTRRVDAFDPALVTIARVAAGTTNNIIPETAVMEGTMRTVSEATRTTVRDLVRRVAQGIADAHGAGVEVEIEPGYPVTVNDGPFAAFVRDVAMQIAGAEAVAEMPAPIMGAEDFSYVLQRVRGAMAFLGARPASEDPATAPMNHSNRVIFDEPAMAVGVAMHTAVALRYLGADARTDA
jgi:hippurate hydrolase